MFDALLLDFRYALRSLRRTPGFTIAAVACLALGVGVNAVMFGVIDRLFLRAPPGIQEPGGLGRVYRNATYTGGSTTCKEQSLSDRRALAVLVHHAADAALDDLRTHQANA